ncbi:hypothetical protein ONS95_002889 [Cadophora gregata]|uniref:uncharacterized protein n=1 Tax=Cadophora gregata TaxID=51156 RepID=UPI0026DACDD7|nr:uncharacterized protein ONS95_002889 [Cadophora gregata]KAK0108068.1 hypothetical protein ONS95_002889 [Cadophora gregata]
MLLSKRTLSIFLVPALFCFFARNYAVSHFYRDPTSKFFDPKRAYEQNYSHVRREEADAFVSASATKTFIRNSNSTPLLCIGIPSIARPSGDVYLRATVGSILEGLTPHERDTIYLMPFIGHTNASEHPVFTEPWLRNVADKVLTYNNSKFVSSEEYIHIQDLENERKRTGLPDREKHMFDYIRVLRECEDVGARYIAVFEDDVLALDGWLHRTSNALEEVERQTKINGQNGFFYLRLFYTEAQLGWNSEEWPVYLYWASPFFLLVVLFHLVIRHILQGTPLLSRHSRIILSASVLTTSLMAVFFLAAGRVSVLPLKVGVNPMDKYGCCAQAIVYPRNKVSMLANWYGDQKIGFVDTLAEKLGDENPNEMGGRWALTPSVVQHLGGRSSKGDAQWDGEVVHLYGKTTGEMIWNFAFELNDPDALRHEHASEAQH